jgi:hypothetical protein
LSPDAQLDLKNTYIKTPPSVFLERRPRRNIETEVVPAKIGGGNAARVIHERFSNLSDINTIDTAMKRE